MSTSKTLASVLLLCLPLALFAQEAIPSDTGTVAAKSAWLELTPEQKTEVMRFAEPYKDYLRHAKSAALSAATLAALAQQSGFTPFTSPSQVKSGARLIINNRDRAIAFVVIGSDPIETGSRVIAAHEDSPHINLKSRPVIQAPGSVALFKTTLYGGLKKYQWSNLPLALVGRIDTVDGRHLQVNIGFAPGDPVFVIADSAPHSDSQLRTRTYTQVLGGEEMNPVAGSIPGDHSTVAQQVMETLRQRFNIHDEDLVSAELELVPATQPADVGLDLGLTGSWGQDDKLSSYVASRAILDLKGTPRKTALAYITNFEEVGSPNNTGAGSQFLDTLFTELVDAQKPPATDLAVRNALRNADVLSADCNDGVNPLFPQNSEASNAAVVGYGVAIKRYGAGFDPNSEFTARILRVLDQNHIAWQTQTPRVEVGGGGTIGGFLSLRNMEVLDVGIPLLSMHAPYEMSSKVDLWSFYRLMSAFYAME
ncbi:peptidase M18 [Alloacidobacterium dinghuense]|uniref:M18 family aminopeptidase n=1 Tax=Alloacidobacterium dinghuense TaxID=2763107 RepID=A0A7G8BEN7_9BACT|nr:peptidase M18 [Alloacidobacterium dinghuense]QNI31007.1 peptidase M18 [Alloacidobacterium dinghuense]